MKKTYMKPEMQVHQILHRGMLLTSGNGKGVYGKIDEETLENASLKYGGYVTEQDEDEFDPD